MATGDQSDMFGRLKNLLPRGWFGDSNPILDALSWGYAQALAWMYSLYLFAKAQTRIKTATGGWLDIAAQDFFGTGLPRSSGMSDASYQNRILINLIRERGTRYAITKVLTDLTGRPPVIFEPRRPADTGAYGATEIVNFAAAPQIYKTTWNGNDLQYQTARTNMLRQSSFQTGWSLGGSGTTSLTPSFGTAPDGTLTAAVLSTLPGGSQYIYQSQTWAAGNSYTISAYAKTLGCSTFAIQSFQQSGAATFNIATGVATGFNGVCTGQAITPLIPSNGWYRCSATFQSNAAGSNNIGFGTYGSSYSGNGFLIWGGQCELGPLTPLIPTLNSAVTVTDYTQGSNGLITFSSAPAAGTPILWSGSGVGASTGNAVSASFQQFATADGIAISFSIRNLAMTAPIAYGVSGGYGSLQMPYQALVTAYRSLNQGFPNIAGYGSPSGGYGQGSQADYASLSQLASVTDADLFAAIEAVRPISTIVWMRISN